MKYISYGPEWREAPLQTEKVRDPGAGRIPE